MTQTLKKKKQKKNSCVLPSNDVITHPIGRESAIHAAHARGLLLVVGARGGYDHWLRNLLLHLLLLRGSTHHDGRGRHRVERVVGGRRRTVVQQALRLETCKSGVSGVAHIGATTSNMIIYD